MMYGLQSFTFALLPSVLLASLKVSLIDVLPSDSVLGTQSRLTSAQKEHAGTSVSLTNPPKSTSVTLSNTTTVGSVNRQVADRSEHIKSGDAAKITSGEHESLPMPVGMPNVRGPSKISPEQVLAVLQKDNSTGKDSEPQPSASGSTTTARMEGNDKSTEEVTRPVQNRFPQALPTSLSTSSQPFKIASHSTTKGNTSITSTDASMVSTDEFKKLENGEVELLSPYGSQAKLDGLWQRLFAGYVKQVPPVPLDGGPLPVGIGINFVKFKGLDAVAGTVNFAICLRLCWDDARLSFDSNKTFNKSWVYGGDKIPIPPEQIWTPDVTVLNGVGSFADLLDVHGSPLVLSDDAFRQTTGVNLLWSRPLDVKSNCEVDMRQYPFDVQTCFIVIGSWTSSRREMHLVPQPFFAENDIHSSEFRVENITVHKRNVYTRGTAQMYNEITYEIVLKRYPHYQVINFILPMLAITLLTLATMWMNSGHQGRVNSATKLLLCVVSIIFITARSRPPIHGDIWIDRFQSHCLALSMSACLESLFIDHISKATVLARCLPSIDVVDAFLRSSLCFLATYILLSDSFKVAGGRDVLESLTTSSTGLLLSFIYLLAIALMCSSIWALIWILMPRKVKPCNIDEDETVDLPLLLNIDTDIRKRN